MTMWQAPRCCKFGALGPNLVGVSGVGVRWKKFFYIFFFFQGAQDRRSVPSFARLALSRALFGLLSTISALVLLLLR